METHDRFEDKVTSKFMKRLNKWQSEKQKTKKKKINDDMALMWLNWSVTTINATLQLLDITSCGLAILRALRVIIFFRVVFLLLVFVMLLTYYDSSCIIYISPIYSMAHADRSFCSWNCNFLLEFPFGTK